MTRHYISCAFVIKYSFYNCKRRNKFNLNWGNFNEMLIYRSFNFSLLVFCRQRRNCLAWSFWVHATLRILDLQFTAAHMRTTAQMPETEDRWSPDANCWFLSMGHPNCMLCAHQFRSRYGTDAVIPYNAWAFGYTGLENFSTISLVYFTWMNRVSIWYFQIIIWCLGHLYEFHILVLPKVSRWWQNPVFHNTQSG